MKLLITVQNIKYKKMPLHCLKSKQQNKKNNNNKKGNTESINSKFFKTNNGKRMLPSKSAMSDSEKIKI